MRFQKLLVTAFAFAAAGVAHAFVPQTGTWVVTSELDGKPGRGLAIDVQNDVFVMQMYAYESNGHPTFYLATGRLANDQVSAPLIRYAGGRFLGSGAQSGQEAGNAGIARFRFTSGVTGFVTLPGESEKAISRFNFGYAFVASSLRGIWNLTSMGSLGLTSEVINLTQSGGSTSTGNGLMATSDGLFGCEHQVSGGLAGTVLCVRINSQGQVQRGYQFVYSVNEGEGYLLNANGSYTNQLVTVRRLTTPATVGTGIVFKEGEQAATNLSLLEQTLDAIAREAAAAQ
ncbi:hypothetical protein [Acidovorax sp.]|uniref:hypothetical protein n=1 Tax=Acidovorax sp. TaxID=1872122 RepID=UPI0039190FA1